jgi:hypothetical protein
MLAKYAEGDDVNTEERDVIIQMCLNRINPVPPEVSSHVAFVLEKILERHYVGLRVVKPVIRPRWQIGGGQTGGQTGGGLFQMTLFECLSYLWHRVFNPTISKSMLIWSEFQKKVTVDTFMLAWENEKDRQIKFIGKDLDFDPEYVSPMGMILLAYLNRLDWKPEQKEECMRYRILTEVFKFEEKQGRGGELHFVVNNNTFIQILSKHLKTDYNVVEQTAVGVVSEYLMFKKKTLQTYGSRLMFYKK